MLGKIFHRTKELIGPIKDKVDIYFDSLFPESDPDVIVAVSRFKEKIKTLPTLDLHTGSAAHKKWMKNRQDIRDLILTRNPNRFMKWGVIRGTMAHDPRPIEFEYVSNLPHWNQWKDALKEPLIGTPPKFRLFPETSGNSLHQAYNLSRFLNATKADIASIKNIIEVGGGYGSMRRLIAKMGFNGTYTIFDLPEFLSLQEFYLSLSLPKGDALTKYIAELTDIESSDQIFDLSIALWSLSEMPLKAREQLERTIGSPRYHLIAYQDRFGGLDNIKYFSEFMRKRPQYKWQNMPIEHLPNNYYLFGKLK